MEFKVSYDRDHDCIRITFDGEVVESELQKLASKLIKVSKEHGCRFILNDMRNATISLSTTDIYNLPKQLTDWGIGHDLKRAIVINKYKDLRFFETVSKNTGQNVQVFTDADEAMHWLKGDQTPKKNS
ncbi:MAG: hypothetical protein V3W18_02625 [candidate division Zixibacteria bacterium]